MIRVAETLLKTLLSVAILTILSFPIKEYECTSIFHLHLFVSLIFIICLSCLWLGELLNILLLNVNEVHFTMFLSDYSLLACGEVTDEPFNNDLASFLN